MGQWVESVPGIIYPEGSASPARPGSNCPQTWTENFDRAAMSTQVVIGYGSPSDAPTFRYVFPADTGAVPPPPGEMHFDAAQNAASLVFFNRTDDLGADATLWLLYLNEGSTIRIDTLAATKESRTYTVTGEPADGTDHVQVPVFWTSGEAPIPHGPVDVTLTITSRVPRLFNDPFGVDHYGTMSFDRTDLISINEDLFVKLADRILEVRASNSVPRLESVTLDARTGHGGNYALMSTADPGKPSRYLMQLAVGDRLIFNRMCFASAVRHFISRDEWTLTITLDLADWAAQL